MSCRLLGKVLRRLFLPAAPEPPAGSGLGWADCLQSPDPTFGGITTRVCRCSCPPRRQEIPNPPSQHPRSRERWGGPSASLLPCVAAPAVTKPSPAPPERFRDSDIFSKPKIYIYHLLGKHFSRRRCLRKDDPSTRSGALCLPGGAWANPAGGGSR